MDVDKVRHDQPDYRTDAAEPSPASPHSPSSATDATGGRRRWPDAEPALGMAPPRKLARTDSADSWRSRSPVSVGTDRNEAAAGSAGHEAVDAKLSSVDFNLIFQRFRSDSLELHDGVPRDEGAALERLAPRLPTLGAAELASIAQGPDGGKAVRALIELADDLKAPPLGLSDDQLARIAAGGGTEGLQRLHALRDILTRGTVVLSPEQVATIACRPHAAEALALAAAKLLAMRELARDLAGLVADGPPGGDAPTLQLPDGSAYPDQLDPMALDGSVDGMPQGDGNAPASLADATLPPGADAPVDAGGRVQPDSPRLTLSLRQVMDIARQHGDRKETQVFQELCAAAGVSASEPLAMLARLDGDVEALKAFQELGSALHATGVPGSGASPSPSASSRDSATSHDSDGVALEAFQAQLSVLQNPRGLGLSAHQVVAISRNADVRSALDTVRALLSVLADPDGVQLSPRQVVAMATDENVRSAQRATQVLMNSLRD
jgi:hypothetical protein